MAARFQSLRRALSLYRSIQQPRIPLSQDKLWQSKSFFSRENRYGSLLQRQFCVSREVLEASVTNGCNSSNCATELAKAPSPVTASEDMIVKYKSQLKINPRHDFMMVFTCKVCETRSMKMASRESYENGVVVVRCGGCDNLHLIADRRGWFGEPGSVEDFLAAQGEEFKKESMDSLNLTFEDLAGEKMSKE
ncbi:hypothetical protein AALP_AA5G183900 [Arabis alpina]|uniref:DNL-type domain-containing protein n=1 Tax=Arabis alpina TaxID=50452 RepID=A0A087GXX0_ARAAL|nr:hypothetical protein AALP_AA5G183900 [Arabis alpina]